MQHRWLHSFLYQILMGWYTSRARASRVTEVSREGRTYKDKAEPIRNSAWPPGWHGRRMRDLLEVFVCHVSCSRHLCLMLPLSLDLACSWHFWILTEFWLPDIFESWQSFLLPSVCLDVFFSPTFQSLDFLVWHCLLIWLAPVIFESWQRLSCWELSSVHSSLPFSVPDTPCCLPVFLQSLHFSTVFNYLLFIASLLSSPF